MARHRLAGVDRFVQVDRSETEPETIVLRFSGILTDGNDQTLDVSLLDEHEYGRPILVSLRDVTLLNSSGIGMLLNLQRRVNQCGGKLVIQHVPAYVKSVLDFMKLGQMLRIAHSEQEAREMLK